MRLRLLVVVLPCSLLVRPSLAQEGEPTVIVRGEPLPPDDSSTSSQMLDEDELESEASGRLENAVRDLGASQFRRADARSAHPTSQGITLRGLGGNAASRVLVLLDGVPQADPFGGWISWPGYDALPLSSVTLERGGGTGAQGAGALAGTLLLTTRDPGDAVEFGGEILGGSRRTITSLAHASFPTGGAQHLLGASAETGDGFVPAAPEQRGPVDERAPYEQAGAAWLSQTTVARTLNLKASGRAFFDRRSRGVAFTENENEGFDLSVRAASVDGKLLPWSAHVYFQSRKLSSSFAAVNDERTEARQVLDQTRVPSNGLGARVAFRPRIGPDVQMEWGADYRHTRGRSEEEYLFVDGAPEHEREAGGMAETGGLFASVSLRPVERITLSGSGRADFWHLHGGFRNERELAGPESSAENFPNRTGIEGTGRLGVGVDIARSVHLRSASYTGHRLPTLNELYRPFRVGADATSANADLDPERLWGTEAGMDVRPFPGLEVSVTAFENHLLGAIANVTMGAGPGTFDGVGFVSEGGAYRQRQNVSSIRSWGADVAINIDDRSLKVPGLALGVNYFLVHSQMRAGGAATPLSGLEPAQVPSHSLASTLSWTSSHDKISLSTTLHYLGEQFDDDLNQIVLDDAWTLDGAARVSLAQRIYALLRVENLTDARVEASKDSSGFTELAAPRTIWVGLAYGR